MTRTKCFGVRCPSYTLTVEPSGHIIFEGLANTIVEGKTGDKLSKAQLAELRSVIEKANFFSFKSKYALGVNCPASATDHPTVLISIRLGKHQKSISHYLGCFATEDDLDRVYPERLYELEDKIDEIVGSKKWIEGIAQ